MPIIITDNERNGADYKHNQMVVRDFIQKLCEDKKPQGQDSNKNFEPTSAPVEIFSEKIERAGKSRTNTFHLPPRGQRK